MRYVFTILWFALCAAVGVWAGGGFTPDPFWDPPTPTAVEEMVEEVPAEAVPYCVNPDTTMPAWKPGMGYDRHYLYAPCAGIPWKGSV